MKECCADPENLVEDERPDSDLVIRICTECGCRHYELSLDPFHVGVEIK